MSADGNCRDCEAPLLPSKENFSRCAPYRAKRNARKAERRDKSPAAIARAHQQIRDTIRAREHLARDGAGSRELVRARRSAAARTATTSAASPLALQ